MADAKIATLEDPKRRILAVWIKLPDTLINRTNSISKAIADLKYKVNSYVRDYIVVNGEGKKDCKDEILVIVNANQLTQDRVHFSALKELVRKAVPGPQQWVDFPKDQEHDPRKIYDDTRYLGWNVIKKRK